MSGYGAGVEDLNVGVGKLAVSYWQGRPDILTQYGAYAKSNIDVRLYGLKDPPASGGWFNYAISKGGEQTSNGAIIPLLTDTPSGCVTKNCSGTTMVITRWRSSTEPERPATSVRRLRPTRFIRSAARFWRGTGASPTQRQVCIMPIAVYQRIKDAIGRRWQTWLSMGARQKSFSRNTSRWRLREHRSNVRSGPSTTAAAQVHDRAANRSR